MGTRRGLYFALGACAGLLLPFNARAQGPPNGSFDVWDTAFFPPLPSHWMNNGSFAGLFCSPYVNSAEQEDDGHGGSAARLTTGACEDEAGSPREVIGFIALGRNNVQLTTLHDGILYANTPQTMSFRYRFQPVGGDSAFARLRLITLDADSLEDEEVATAEVVITAAAEEWTTWTAPITYASATLPQVLQIVFSTSPTLSRNGLLSSPAVPWLHPGTAFHVDDVQLTGGTADVAEHVKVTGLTVWPNPAEDGAVRIALPPGGPWRVELLDVQGRRCAVEKDPSTDVYTPSHGPLAPGTYIVRAAGANGTVLRGRLVVTGR